MWSALADSVERGVNEKQVEVLCEGFLVGEKIKIIHERIYHDLCEGFL